MHVCALHRRSDDEVHYEREVTQASLDTDSEDDRLPDFSESVVATSNDHADKCEARLRCVGRLWLRFASFGLGLCCAEALHGPWDLEDLQGVWFLSEASPKDGGSIRGRGQQLFGVLPRFDFSLDPPSKSLS